MVLHDVFVRAAAQPADAAVRLHLARNDAPAFQAALKAALN